MKESREIVYTEIRVGQNFPMKSGEVLRIKDGGGKLVEKWEVGAYLGHPLRDDYKEDTSHMLYELNISYL